MRNSAFNWQPQGPKAEMSALDGSSAALSLSGVAFDHPMLRRLERDTEPTTVFVDTDDGISCRVYFPLNRFSTATMERFGRNFLTFLGVLMDQPNARVMEVQLVP